MSKGNFRYNFWDGTAHEGGREITLDAPLEQLPLLVRAGSILPMEESEQLILHLYPPAEGTSAGYLYGDAGDGYGEWRLEQFRMMRSHGAHRPEGRSQDGLELIWQQQGDYAFPYKSVRLHLHGFKVQQAWVDEKEVAVQGQQLECQPFRQVRFEGEFAAVTP
ncbi:hypothetical protein NDI49_31485 [Trichocoleus sp. ST-U3]